MFLGDGFSYLELGLLWTFVSFLFTRGWAGCAFIYIYISLFWECGKVSFIQVLFVLIPTFFLLRFVSMIMDKIKG